MTRKYFSGQGRVTPILPMSPEATGWRRAGRPDEPERLQASLRGCNAEATRCNRAGDIAWAPRCSAGRTAGSAGPRRRNAPLRWAMRGQDPLKEQRVPGSAGLLGDRTRVSGLSSLEQPYLLGLGVVADGELTLQHLQQVLAGQLPPPALQDGQL